MLLILLVFLDRLISNPQLLKIFLLLLESPHKLLFLLQKHFAQKFDVIYFLLKHMFKFNFFVFDDSGRLFDVLGDGVDDFHLFVEHVVDTLPHSPVPLLALLSFI